MIPLRNLIAPALFVAANLAACTQQKVVAQTPQSVEITVTGMTCSNCEDTISSALLALEGVQSCTASFEESRVSVTFDPALTSGPKVVEAIRATGFEVPADK